MDISMRDLEQIQEHGEPSRGRQLGLLALGGLCLGGLFFAVTTALGDANTDNASDTPDPLARLAQAENIAPGAQLAAQAPTVRREDMTFPTALIDDPHSELAAALARAAAEQANPEPIDPAAALAALAPPAASAAVPSTLPAAVAAGSAGRLLSRPVSTGDTLMAAAAIAEDNAPRASAPAGAEGAYTVQVISYDEAAEADAFAAALRARGHRAFVIAADVPNRGRLYRVRIGPFERLHEAEGYRRDFEAREHMNTLIVRRDRSQSAAAE